MIFTHSLPNAEIVHMLSVFLTSRKINTVERSGMSVGTLTAERHTLPRHSCTSCVDYTWLYTWNVVSIWPSLFLYVGSVWHWRGNQLCRASSASSLCSRSGYNLGWLDCLQSHSESQAPVDAGKNAFWYHSPSVLAWSGSLSEFIIRKPQHAAYMWAAFAPESGVKKLWGRGCVWGPRMFHHLCLCVCVYKGVCVWVCVFPNWRSAREATGSKVNGSAGVQFALLKSSLHFWAPLPRHIQEDGSLL